jgi:peptidoglycan/LPS O-acetylase OafA/YrhL
MREIKAHTALRGIAALLVVIFHYRVILRPRLDIDIHTNFFSKGYLWVDCFFMLSGFILYRVYGARPVDAHEFMRARFARVYPLHLATLLGLAAMFAIMPRVSHQRFDPNWSTLFLNAIDIHAWGFLNDFDWNFPSWSISVEFAAYLLFPIICVGIATAPTPTIVLMSLSSLIPLWLGHDHWERLALLHGLPLFFIGIVISILPKKDMAPLQVAAGFVLVLSMSIGLSDAISDICFAAIVYTTQSDTGPMRWTCSRPLLLLGAWSYSIYMLHIPIWYFANATIGSRLTPVEMFLFSISATIVAGAVSYRFFETPLRDAMRRQPRLAYATS